MRFQDRSEWIKVINIQRGIRRKDQYLMKFGESIGVRYIGVLEFRREYFWWILAQQTQRNDSVADIQEYAIDRNPRYDFPIIGRGYDGEMDALYDDVRTKVSDIDAEISGVGNIGRRFTWCMWCDWVLCQKMYRAFGFPGPKFQIPGAIICAQDSIGDREIARGHKTKSRWEFWLYLAIRCTLALWMGCSPAEVPDLPKMDDGRRRYVPINISYVYYPGISPPGGICNKIGTKKLRNAG